MGSRLRCALAAAAASGCLVGAPTLAHADLQDEASALAAALAAEGFDVRRGAPQFVQASGRTVVRSSAGELFDDVTSSGRCTTLVVLAPRASQLMVTSAELPLGADADREPWQASSRAGVAIVSRCGDRRSELQRLALAMQAGRAAVELLYARGKRRLERIEHLLPTRAVGPEATAPLVGPPAPPASVAARVELAQRRMRKRGATDESERASSSFVDGSGGGDRLLLPGCHDLVVISPAASSGRPVDVDAELVRDDGRLLARDGSDSTDAHLEVCVGEPTRARLAFSGASPLSRVTLLHGRYELPRGLPAGWSPHARATLASAMRRRHIAELRGAPLTQALGVGGIETRVPFEGEPGRCYVAASADVRGDARLLRLSVTGGFQQARDHGTGEQAALVAFCLETDDPVSVGVEGRSESAAWFVGVWGTD